MKPFMSVVGHWSGDTILGDFSHMQLVVCIMFMMRI